MNDQDILLNTVIGNFEGETYASFYGCLGDENFYSFVKEILNDEGQDADLISNELIEYANENLI
tara:strand:+ start:185 stop:376 length:192 start_codon:yes stop_codon:yes gene_type:complete